MDKKKKILLVAGVSGAIVLLLLMRRGGSAYVNVPADGSNGYGPGSNNVTPGGVNIGGSGGFNIGDMILTGGSYTLNLGGSNLPPGTWGNSMPTFTNVNNISVDAGQFSGLSNQFVPLFGLIGAGGGGYRQVNATAVFNQVNLGQVSPQATPTSNNPVPTQSGGWNMVPGGASVNGTWGAASTALH